MHDELDLARGRDGGHWGAALLGLIPTLVHCYVYKTVHLGTTQNSAAAVHTTKDRKDSVCLRLDLLHLRSQSFHGIVRSLKHRHGNVRVRFAF